MVYHDCVLKTPMHPYAYYIFLPLITKIWISHLQKEKKKIFVGDPLFFTQTLNGKCQMRGSYNRSEGGVGHTS